jgi:hypothetical protein
MPLPLAPDVKTKQTQCASAAAEAMQCSSAGGMPRMCALQGVGSVEDRAVATASKPHCQVTWAQTIRLWLDQPCR